MQPTLQDIELALHKSWSRETAQIASSWNPDNPAAGQCWQSACVVRHFCGAEIIIAEILPLNTDIVLLATKPCSRFAPVLRQPHAAAPKLHRGCHPIQRPAGGRASPAAGYRRPVSAHHRRALTD